MTIKQNSELRQSEAHRTDELQPLTAALLKCVTPSEVISVVVERGMVVLGAGAGLVALVTRDGQELEIVRTRGYSAETTDKWAKFAVNGPFPLSEVVRLGEPLYLENRGAWTARFPNLASALGKTFQSSVSLPLSAHQRMFGAIHFSFSEAREFSAEDRAFLDELGQQCAMALERAHLLEEVEQARRHQEILAQASALLGDSLDYYAALESLARLCIPEISDWAAIDILSEDDSLQRIVLADRVPERETAMRKILQELPSESQLSGAILTIIRTSHTLHLPEITEEVLEGRGLEPGYAHLLKTLGLRSVLCVPFISAGKPLGAITLGLCDGNDVPIRSFNQEIITLAEELARRAGVAVERTRLYRAAEAAQARAETVLESIGDAFFALDRNWRFTYVNNEAERFLLKRREDLLGRILWDEFPAAVGTTFESEYRRAMGEKVTGAFVAYYPQPLDSWFDVRAYPSETGLSVYFRNINEGRRQAEERERLLQEQERLLLDLEKANARQQRSLRESEERFRLLVEGVRDYAIFLLDPDGKIATWNAGAQRFKGYRASEIIGSHVSRFYTEEDIARRHPWNELEIAKEQGRYEEEGWRVRKDGSRFWAHVIISALWDESGRLQGFAKVTRDVTERRNREKERSIAEMAEQQRRLLKDILAYVTEGRLILCDDVTELPVPLTSDFPGKSILLSRPALKAVRSAVIEVAAKCEMPRELIQDLVTAASECAMNAVQHAEKGTARILGEADKGIVQVWIEDQGKGIDLSNLPRATLERGYSTGGSGFGHGFNLMLACCQRIYLLTGPAGTTVVIEQERTSPTPTWLE